MTQAHSVRIGVKTHSHSICNIIMKQSDFVRISIIIGWHCVRICILMQAHSVRIDVKTHSDSVCNIITKQSHCVMISIMIR